MPPSKTSKIAFSDWTPEILTAKRQELGFNKTKMAEALGVTYRQYLYYETGHTKLSKALEHHVNDMLGVKDEPGTLTDFERDRVNRLLDAVENHPLDDLDERTQKILRQIPQEMGLLLSKL